MSIESRDAAALPDLLDRGPFPDALRAAIRARGLGLERLRQRLRSRGVSVSLATLSYWQSGRSRPERRDSLVALRHLEAVLDLPDGALAALLGPPRPRGRWLGSVGDSPAIGAFWSHPGPVEEAVREVDITWDERLTRISQHDRVLVGPDGGEQAYVSRQVLRAEADGPDRWVVILHTDEHDRPPPTVRPLRHCGLGRVVNRPGAGLMVAELLFDRPLAKGETVITEYELVNAAPCPVDANYERKFRLPVREFVLEVCFDPAAVPDHCEQYTRDEHGVETAQPAELDRSRSVHGVALNFGPGCYGFRWGWTVDVAVC
ncbi:helix-turn-helix domain-containing protein [Actinokineospora sp.]|uniref:helix-turn-helix domain-containing protein n=1 Tax=Actinokineospora sp. TaxID=1872133 RepID=UPI004037951F